MAESSQKVAGLVSEIAAASAEQAQGIDQVNQAMNQMDQVIQQNAANAEESAAASEEMNGQAEAMNGMVDELVSLITGAKGQNGNGSAAKSLGSSAGKIRLLPRPDGSRKVPALRTEVKPEEVIPFDDEQSELSDF